MTLPDFRARIDALDARIVRMLADRLAVCRDVAVYKRDRGLPVMQPERVEMVKEKAASAAVAAGLDRAFVLQVYSLIIDEACRIEDDIMRGATAAHESAPPRRA